MHSHILRRAGWTMGACSLAANLTACSLMSLDGLTGAEADGGTVMTSVFSEGGAAGGDGSDDAGESPPIGDATASDTAAKAEDAPAGDGNASNDSGLQGSSDAESSDTGSQDAGSGGGPDSSMPLGFCAGLGTAPLFCDDFDEGAALASAWDQLTSTNGSETVSGSSCVSSPDSMRVAVAANAPVTSIDVAGYKSFKAKQGVAGTATVSFEIRIDAADTSSASDAILGAIQLWNGSAYYDLELEVFYVSATNDFKVSMSEYGSTSTYVQHVATPHIPLSTWTKIAMGITLPAAADGSAPATLSIGGTNVLNVTAHVTTSDPIPEILIGTTFATPTAGTWSMAYDNVVFEEP